MAMIFAEVVQYGALVLDLGDDDLFGQRQGIPLAEHHLRHAHRHHAMLRLPDQGRMRHAAKIQKKQSDTPAAERLDQITGEADAALGNGDGAETVERIMSGLAILPDRHAVAIQPQEGAVVTDDEVFHSVIFASSGNLPGFLMISLVRSISIVGQ